MLKQVYKVMSPERDIELAHLAEGIQKFGAIKLSSITYGSKMQSRGIRSSKILASWPDNGQVLQDRFVCLLGPLRYYFRHSVQLGGEHLSHFFSCIRWYIPHEESTTLYGNPIMVYKNKFYPGGPSAFMPVQRIFSRFTLAEVDVEGQKPVVMAPINRNVQL